MNWYIVAPTTRLSRYEYWTDSEKAIQLTIAKMLSEQRAIGPFRTRAKAKATADLLRFTSGFPWEDQ